MTEQGWVVAAIVLVAGLLSGLALAGITRKRADEPEGKRDAREQRIAELEARRAQLMEQLRLSGIEAASADEKAAIERDAGLVLRELDELRAAPPEATATVATELASTPAAPPAEAAATVPSPAAPAAPAAPSASATKGSWGLSPQLAGAIKGGAVVAVGFVLYLALTSQTGPRAPGASITGNDAVAPMGAGASTRAPAASSSMAAGQGDGQEARSLTAVDTPRLRAARAEVAANPSSHAARVELGWALVDAGGWIEVYRLAEALLNENESDADGLALAVAVRVAMGQREGLAPLVDQAIDAFPNHPMLLAWRGRVAQLTGDAAGAERFWARARTAASGDAELDALIGDFRRTPAATPSPHPGPGAAPARPATTAEAGFEGGVSGTVKLASGVTAPPGGVLFLIARRAGADGGPPAATRKIVGPSFPRAFTLGPADLMMGGEFPERVTVQARLDSDGDPLTRSPSDLVAAWPSEVRAGQRGVVLELAPGR